MFRPLLADQVGKMCTTRNPTFFKFMYVYGWGWCFILPPRVYTFFVGAGGPAGGPAGGRTGGRTGGPVGRWAGGLTEGSGD